MSIAWAKAAAIRAVKTICQTAIALIGTEAVLSSVDWMMVVSASLLSGLISILTSIAGLPETTVDTTQVGGETAGDTETDHEGGDPDDEEGTEEEGV